MVDTSNQLVPEMAIDYWYAPTKRNCERYRSLRGDDFSDFSFSLRSKATMFKA